MRRRKLNLSLVAVAVSAALCIVVPSASAEPLQITGFDGGAFLENEDPATEAGSHPYSASADFTVATKPTGIPHLEFEVPLEDFKDAIVNLPPGVVGNPQAVKTCTAPEFAAGPRACPPESQVGVFTLENLKEQGAIITRAPIYNLKAPKGTAALLGFSVNNFPFTISAGVRSGGDYGITTTARNANETLSIAGAGAEIWGVPAEHSHDALRGRCLPETGSPSGQLCPSAEAADPKAFFTLPTSCIGPVKTELTLTGWQGGTDSASFLSHDNTTPVPNPIGTDGCAGLDFSPTLKARPTTNVADSPTGFEVDLHIPQEGIANPTGTVEANLKDTVVTLPEGLVINPSGANGLDGCSSAQIGFKGFDSQAQIDEFTPGPANCPDASKVGTVEVDTPLLDHPLPGAVYVATPHDNPFDSLLAIYIAVDDPISGTVVKLAGEVDPDPLSGQLTSTFANNPQLPFEDFKLAFFGGAGAALRTPATCGTYSTTSSLTPWSAPDSGPPATPSDTYAIDQAAGGGPCATSAPAQPHAPSFDAGTVSPIAGAFSPEVINLRREDGSQNFSTVTLTQPPGLLGRLAATPTCPDSALAAAEHRSGREEEAHPSCPAASEVGTVIAGAGAGPAPYYARGKAYLSGPYKGAPLSLAIITPATAGPFDLGTIVIKTALYVDPVTTQITAKSDPIPSILQGIPLDVRSAQIRIDKPDFTLNGTSCDPLAFSGRLLSTLGQGAPLEQRFQLGECGRLAFKPSLSLKLKGGTKRGDFQRLSATVTYPKGAYANIASASVALPHSAFLAQEHIRTVCTRPQFAAGSCPPGSIYGHAKATSPLVDYPLEGPVYLRSSDNLLPDLVVALKGPDSQPIEVDLDGRTDSIHGGIRNTFDFVPDAPVSKFTLQLLGGKRSLIVNSRNLCNGTQRATVKMEGQNGKAYDFRPVVGNSCGKGKHKRRGGG